MSTPSKIQSKTQSKTLLHIDSSPLAAASISRHLTAEYVRNWQLANPTGTVLIRDTTTTNIPPITADWVAAAYTPEAGLTPTQREILSLSDTLIAELQSADEYLLGVPMHNFSIASTLKLWIDQIARVNKTFSYSTGRPVGLLTGKRATIILSSGGSYDPGTAMASYNHAEPYLRTVLAFLGVTDTTFIAASGAAALMHGADREQFLAPIVATIQSHFEAA